MTLTLDTPIMGYRPVDQNEIYHRLDRPDGDDAESLRLIDKYAEIAGIDAAVPSAQALLETDDFRSIRYTRDKALAGVGIVSDGTVQPFTLASLDESARLFIQCLSSLVTRQRHPSIPLDGDVEDWFMSVWIPKVNSEAMPNVRVLGDLGLRYTENGDSRATWSWEDGKVPQNTYGKKLISRLNEFYPDLPARTDAPVTPGGDSPMPPVFDPEILKPKTVYRYVYKRRDGQGFDYGTRGPIKGLFVHERQGRIGNSPKIGQQFFTCWTDESCSKFDICEDGERCANALVDYEILRDGTLVEYQDPWNTDRIPYASGGTIKNWTDPVGIFINNNFANVNRSFAATETEKNDDERLSPEQIETVGRLGAYTIAKGGGKKREFWQLPNHAQAYASTNCAMFADDRTKFEAVCDRYLADFWAGRLPEQTGGTTPPDTTTYAPPIKVDALAQYMDADPNTVPATIRAEGSDWIYVNDVVKVTKDTPRLQRAKASALHVGGDVRKGEDFTAKFMVKADDGNWYYLTRFWTRIQAKNTTRSKDSV